MTLFDWLKEINYKKSSPNTFTDKDWEGFNSYMINRFLSMNPKYVEFVNYAQIIPPQNKKQLYSVYREAIPKNKSYSKYQKSNSKELNKDLLKHLSEHFSLSIREVKDYYDLIDKKQIKTILSHRGLEDKEIKKLLK